MKKNSVVDERGCLDLVKKFFEQAIEDSVSILLGETPKITPSTGGATPDQALWFRINFKAPSKEAIVFGGSKPLWLELGTRILEAADEMNPDGPAILATLKELAMQAAGSITMSLNHQFQQSLETGELQVIDESIDFGVNTHALFCNLVLSYGKELPLTIIVPKELIESLLPPKPAAAPVVQAAPMPSSVDAKRLELLLDVEMPVSVSIGRTQMPLKEVVKLTTGSIVELSKHVSEPVDVVVNNCVVARGDVVVVEGNFGVRIREVLSREDRLRRFAPKH